MSEHDNGPECKNTKVHTHTLKIEIEECQKVDDKRQKREESGGRKNISEQMKIIGVQQVCVCARLCVFAEDPAD